MYSRNCDTWSPFAVSNVLAFWRPFQCLHSTFVFVLLFHAPLICSDFYNLFGDACDIRRSSETSCIFYSGYLLKRSNAPLDISRRESDKESGSSDAGSRGGAPLVPEETLFVLDNCGDVGKSGQSKNLLRLPVPPLTGSAESEDKVPIADDDKAVQAQEAADLVAALSFGLDINKPSAQDVKAATKEHVGPDA